MTRVQITIRRRDIMLLAVVLALLTAGGVAYATIPDSNNVYEACMLKATGTVRLIDPSLPKSNLLGHCTSVEKPVSWNQQGQQGIQGPKGDQGDPGKNGVDGMNGVDGKDGAPGAAGADGAPGADGRDGAGVTSANEPAGANCAYGGSAFAAANGVTYACNGVPGSDGKDGIDGRMGPQGARGAQGPTGPAGPALADLDNLNGVPCHGDDSDWAATIEVSVGPGAEEGGAGGSVTLKCVPVTPKTLSLSWEGPGAIGVRYVGGSSQFLQCFQGLQPGPIYTCSASVIPGREVQIEASGGTTTIGTVVSWGGACAGLGSISGSRGQCRLTMDSDKSASVVFSP